MCLHRDGRGLTLIRHNLLRLCSRDVTSLLTQLPLRVVVMATEGKSKKPVSAERPHPSDGVTVSPRFSIRHQNK